MAKRGRGRPRTEINKQALEGIVSYGATCLECANEFDTSEDTIVRFVKKEYGLNFAEFSHKKQGSIRVRLRQKQIQMALAGNVTMLVWLGKQMLGQSEDNIPHGDKEVYTPLDSLKDDDDKD